MEKYRHELKYLIDDEQMLLIRKRLEMTMRLDGHVKKDRYLISSLYFDDPEDSCFYDVAAGVDLRKKYRIRYYDHNPEHIFLECKAKKQGLMLKKSSLLSKEQSSRLVKGVYLRDVASLDELKKELVFQVMAKAYRPKVIVEYERIPFVYRNGNVRITFDLNVRSSTDLNNFLGNYRNCRPILPVGKQILEVKYDEYLPRFVYDCINIGNLQQLSFSKYALCRKYISTAEELI